MENGGYAPLLIIFLKIVLLQETLRRFERKLAELEPFPQISRYQSKTLRMKPKMHDRLSKRSAACLANFSEEVGQRNSVPRDVRYSSIEAASRSVLLSSREFVKRGFAVSSRLSALARRRSSKRREAVTRWWKKEDVGKKQRRVEGEGREGMCPKRRMHAETRKRYIRGLAAGDGRPGPSFFYLYV